MGITSIPVAKISGIPQGTMKPIDLDGRRLVVANVEGDYFAFPAECPHEGANLAAGDIEGPYVRCDNHSYYFDLRSGVCVDPPDGPSMVTLPVEVQGEDVCIKLEW